MGVEAYPQLTMKAAALLESVARFHPLIDGNKRTAWTLMVLMLWINGHQHNFRTDEGFDLVVGVGAGSVPLERSASLIAAHLIPGSAAFDFVGKTFPAVHGPIPMPGFRLRVHGLSCTQWRNQKERC